MQYQVRSVGRGEASVQQQVLEAPDEAALRQRMLDAGQTVLSVQPVAKRWAMPQRATRNRYPVFCREVRTLIQAGMTIVEAVDTLSARAGIEGRADNLSAELLVRLQQGQSLSGALAALPDTPVVLIAAVRAGERTSNLVEALDDYLRYDTLIAQLRRKLVSAAIYPSLVTALGIAISIFLLMVVMPNFARMYDNLRGPATGRTAVMIAISQFMSQNRAEVLIALLLFTAALVVWIRSGDAKRALLRLGHSNTWLRRRIEDFELAMMYQALALLLKGGYPMMEAMTVAAQSALSQRLRAALGQARALVERGGAVSQALASAQLCDEVGRRLMAAAERNGDFYVAADVVAQLHGERFELFVERVTRVIEPVLLLSVALMVGAIVITMYLPVFDMATQLR